MKGDASRQSREAGQVAVLEQTVSLDDVDPVTGCSVNKTAAKLFM